MPTEKDKIALKRFLTFNPDQDWDNDEIKNQITDIFRNIMTSNDPAMKEVVSAMFNSFNKYNSDEDVVGDKAGEKTEEPPAEEPPAEEEPAPEEEAPEEESDGGEGEEEQASAEEMFADSFLSNKNILEDINYWLE